MTQEEYARMYGAPGAGGGAPTDVDYARMYGAPTTTGTGLQRLFPEDRMHALMTAGRGTARVAPALAMQKQAIPTPVLIIGGVVLVAGIGWMLLGKKRR